MTTGAHPVVASEDALPEHVPAPESAPRAWRVFPARPEQSGSLARELGIHPVVAQVLLNREVGDPMHARRFLKPDLNALRPPGDLPDIARAVDRVNRALRDGETIVVWGDYDVDGLTSATILINMFRFLGRDVGDQSQIRYYVPHRLEEGYGLSTAAIEQFARDGVRLLITCDCGTCDVEQITRAAELGIDVIVTDHHEPDPVLPPAYAIVNPKVPGARYPFLGLCGAGLTFKLAWALGMQLSQTARVSDEFRNFLLDAMALVALGTVADVAPLHDENRVLVAYGLVALRDTLRHTRNPGLSALLRGAGMKEREAVSATDIGFRIAPLLNACGRMKHARLGFELLTARDPHRIDELVVEIDRLNKQRQECGRIIHEQARKKVGEEIDLARERIIVLGSEQWHPGVVGIVASKLVEEFRRPVVLVGFQPDPTVGRGSARTVPGMNIHQALTACAHAMEGFGGHAMAGGLSVRADRLGELRRALNEFVDRLPAGSSAGAPLEIDAEIPFEATGRDLVRQLDLLGPHGNGNPRPVFCTRGVRVAGEPKLMGKSRDHLSFMVTNGQTSVKAVGFGMSGAFAAAAQARHGGLAIAYTIDVNKWLGRESVEFMLKDFRVEAT